MTPLELSYPLTGLVLALGSGVYVWKSRLNLEKRLAQSQNSDPGQSVADETDKTADVPDAREPQSSQEEVHLKGKLRRLEKDLEKAQTNLQNISAERDELSKNYQSQEKMVAALQQQLTHYDDIQSERFVGLQKLNQELLQENTNLSDRLKQAVNEVAETRPKLVRMQTLETRNGQLTDQLNHVEQNQEKAIATRLEAQEKVWQGREQDLKNQLIEGQQQLESLTGERDQARQSLQHLTEQSKSTQGQLETLKASLVQLTQAEQQWQGQRTQLQTKLNQLEDSQKALALANAELKLKLETTQTEGDRLKAEKKEQSTALQSAQGEIAQLQQQLADLEKIKVPKKVEELPPEELVKTESVKTTNVITAPEPEPVVTVKVDQPEQPLIAEVEPVKAEIELSKKVAEEQVEIEEIPTKTEETPLVTVTPEPLPEKTAEAIETEANNGDHPLAGKKVVILGTLNAMNREEAKTRLQNVEAECTSAPSGKTDYIVVGKAPGAKLKKAQKLGIPQLSEAQFLELLGH